jgi:hypothetical protein
LGIGGTVMLGYEYKDIQEFGGALTVAIDTAISEEVKKGLLEIWNFFEGLLAEGYFDHD